MGKKDISFWGFQAIVKNVAVQSETELCQFHLITSSKNRIDYVEFICKIWKERACTSLSPKNFQIYKKWPSPVFCFSRSMVYWGYKINKTKKFFCQIFILWILEVCDLTGVKKDPKTHENSQTIEWNSLKKVKIFWILYLDDSSRKKDI